MSYAADVDRDMDDALDRAIRALLQQVQATPHDQVKSVLLRVATSLANPAKATRVTAEEAAVVAPYMHVTPDVAVQLASVVQRINALLPVMSQRVARSLQPLTTLLHALNTEARDDASDNLYDTLNSMLLSTTSRSRNIQKQLQLALIFSMYRGLTLQELANILCTSILAPARALLLKAKASQRNARLMDWCVMNMLRKLVDIDEPLSLVDNQHLYEGAFAALHRAFRAIAPPDMALGCSLRDESSKRFSEAQSRQLRTAILARMGAGDVEGLQRLYRENRSAFTALQEAKLADAMVAPQKRAIFQDYVRQFMFGEHPSTPIDVEASSARTVNEELDRNVFQRRVRALDVTSSAAPANIPTRHDIMGMLKKAFAAVLELNAGDGGDGGDVGADGEADADAGVDGDTNADANADVWATTMEGAGADAADDGEDGAFAVAFDDNDEPESVTVRRGQQRDLLSTSTPYTDQPMAQQQLQHSWMTHSDTLTPLHALQPIDPSWITAAGGKRLVSLGTLAEGSCFHHTLLYATDPEYRKCYKRKDYSECRLMALRLRKRLAAQKRADYQKYAVDKVRSMPHVSRPLLLHLLQHAYSFQDDQELWDTLSDLTSTSRHLMMNWFADKLGVNMLSLDIRRRKLFCATHANNLNSPFVLLCIRRVPKPDRVIQRLERRGRSFERDYWHIEVVGAVKRASMSNGSLTMECQWMWDPKNPEDAADLQHFRALYEANCPCATETSATETCPLPSDHLESLQVALRDVQLGQAARDLAASS